MGWPSAGAGPAPRQARASASSAARPGVPSRVECMVRRLLFPLEPGAMRVSEPATVSGLEAVYRWRRLDVPGLEVLRVAPAPDGLHLASEVMVAGAEPFTVAYDWRLDAKLRTRWL